MSEAKREKMESNLLFVNIRIFYLRVGEENI